MKRLKSDMNSSTPSTARTDLAIWVNAEQVLGLPSICKLGLCEYCPVVVGSAGVLSAYEPKLDLSLRILRRGFNSAVARNFSRSRSSIPKSLWMLKLLGSMDAFGNFGDGSIGNRLLGPGSGSSRLNG